MKNFEEAQRVLETEAKAILDLKNRLDYNFEKAVELMFSCTGKVVVTGMGKSGHIGRKLAATLSSTGTPSFYVHPAESSHGDLGMVTKQDVLIAISYSGETRELGSVIAYCSRKNIPMIAMTGGLKSSLAQASQSVLDVSVSREACPLGLAPTASTTATLAMGDALAMTLHVRRGFRAEDFAEFHPGGSLGTRLLLRVKDVMHSGEALPIVPLQCSLREVVSKMTGKEVRGVAGVIDGEGTLVGVVTDGDLRRRLEKSADPLNGVAEDLMSRHPKTVDSNEMAERALFLMEQFAIQVLFVVDVSVNPHRPVGILHLQDLLKAKIR